MGGGWGVLRYLPDQLDHDGATFDGWFSDRYGAEQRYFEWCAEFPEWITALVEYHEIKFEDHRFCAMRRPMEASRNTRPRSAVPFARERKSRVK